MLRIIALVLGGGGWGGRDEKVDLTLMQDGSA